MIGELVSHYRILDKIGAGGMGEVYRAAGTNLEREVALKVLPPEVASDEERRVRFRREAKIVAALNHPNIVTIYAVEEADDVHFLTIELVGRQGHQPAPALRRIGRPGEPARAPIAVGQHRRAGRQTDSRQAAHAGRQGS